VSHTYECLGCGKQFFQPRGNATIPVCFECKKNPDKKNRAVWKHRMNQMQKRIDDEAQRDTKNLRSGEAFTPIQAERIIEKMQRGEW